MPSPHCRSYCQSHWQAGQNARDVRYHVAYFRAAARDQRLDELKACFQRDHGSGIDSAYPDYFEGDHGKAGENPGYSCAPTSVTPASIPGLPGCN